MPDCTAQSLASLGNYAGLATLNNNPSLPVFSKLQFDINLVSVNAFAFNNMIYADRSDDFNLLQNKVTRGKLFADVEINGPGLLWVGQNRSIAFKTSLKTLACSNGINQDVSDMLFNEIKGGSTDSVIVGIIDNKQTNALSYGELAISFAKITRNNGTRVFSIGYTGKLLLGFSAASFSGSNTEIGHRDDTVSYMSADLRYAYAFPKPNSGRSMFRIRGVGIGSDFGVTFMKRRFAKQKFSGCPSVIKRIIPANHYSYKLSIALLNVGGIILQNEAHLIELSSIRTSLDTLSIRELQNAHHFDSLLTERAETNTRTSSFYVGLPTTITIQYDRYLGGQFFFVHGYFAQRLITDKGIRMFRANQFSICPRYETPYWELGLKMGAIEYRFPVIGAMARARSVSIGVDYITDPSFNIIYGGQVNIGLAINQIKGRRMPKMRF